VIKGVQRGFMPYPDAWLNVEPGAVIEKSFYLDAWPVAAEGSAFQHAVKRSIALFQPFFADDLPAIAEIVRAKYRYAKTRWKETPDYAIFQKYGGSRSISLPPRHSTTTAFATGMTSGTNAGSERSF
jgi:hypothetical protein